VQLTGEEFIFKLVLCSSCWCDFFDLLCISLVLAIAGRSPATKNGGLIPPFQSQPALSPPYRWKGPTFLFSLITTYLNYVYNALIIIHHVSNLASIHVLKCRY
jgi:hypothetical protein